MSTTRRHFIKMSAATAVALRARSTTLFAGQSVKPLRILILGGTGFTGPYQVRYALSRGHKVTTFNRGKTHPGELPKDVEQLVGDRNGQLDALRDRQWDVAIDNPTTLPAGVRDAAQILKGNVERYVFISTISVYADTAQGVDETAPLAKYDGPDPYKETIEAVKASGYKTYGPLKALSEKEAEKWFAGKTLIVRPGLIVGPRDETDRFTYCPVGIDRGGGAIVLRICRCASTEAVKSWLPGNQAIRCSSSMRATWRNRQSAWRKIARPEFITQPAPPSLSKSVRCSTESKMHSIQAPHSPGYPLNFSNNKKLKRGRTCRFGPVTSLDLRERRSLERWQKA